MTFLFQLFLVTAITYFESWEIWILTFLVKIPLIALALALAIVRLVRWLTHLLQVFIFTLTFAEIKIWVFGELRAFLAKVFKIATTFALIEEGIPGIRGA